jgi:hypothetical protein
MSIINKGEVGTIVCGDCEARIHIASKDSLAPSIVDVTDITCPGCIEIIENIMLEKDIVLLQIEKKDK